VLALAGLFLLGLFSTELADSDAWWHLASGRYVAETHHLPAPDPFAYTTAGAGDAYAGEAATRHFNLTHEWLAQLAMYGLETVGGSGAVVAGKALPQWVGRPQLAPSPCSGESRQRWRRRRLQSSSRMTAPAY